MTLLLLFFFATDHISAVKQTLFSKARAKELREAYLRSRVVDPDPVGSGVLYLLFYIYEHVHFQF